MSKSRAEDRKRSRERSRSEARSNGGSTSQQAKDDRGIAVVVCAFLAAIVWAVFGQTLGHGFVNYDDNVYIYENPTVQKGLTFEGFRWALTYGEIGHWHPLTWWTHMLDCQLYGLNAGGHHLTNVLLHGAAVILLFLVLRSMTGALWRSAFVAAVFAIHPLRVESVAWIAERKDVLSAVFFMLTLGAYWRYVRLPSSKFRYGAVVVLFALGLLAKNMLVTLPFVLLLLDYWPLRRVSEFTPAAIRPLVREKIPLFGLALASCVATALVPETLVADRMGFVLRLENAGFSYATYLWQMVDPSRLAVLYPNPIGGLPLWQVGISFAALATISAGVYVWGRTRPYLVVGWLWYLGMLVPVIGLVQIANYGHADRYTYLPQIGVYLMLTWGVADLSAGWPARRVILGGLSACILSALLFSARLQTSYWQDSQSLWRHTLAGTSNNPVAEMNLGVALNDEGRSDEALDQYRKAVALDPRLASALNNLGDLLLQKGQVDEAIGVLQKALAVKPNYAEALNNLGNALVQKGRVEEGVGDLRRSLEINPAFAPANYNLGNYLLQKGELDGAIVHYQRALASKPDFVDAANNLGSAFLQKGDLNDAIGPFQKVVAMRPDLLEPQRALNGIAWAMATSPDSSVRNGVEAVGLAEQLDRLTGGVNPVVASTLAAAYAEMGRFPDAVTAGQRAVQLAAPLGNAPLLDAVQAQLKVYQAGSAFRQAPASR